MNEQSYTIDCQEVDGGLLCINTSTGEEVYIPFEEIDAAVAYTESTFEQEP